MSGIADENFAVPDVWPDCAPIDALDGRAGKQLSPPPANLVDAMWIHGSTDGEIFLVIRDGVKDTGMKAFGSRMTTHQMWDVLNYLRSIGPDSASTPR